MAKAKGNRKRGRSSNGLMTHVFLFVFCLVLMLVGKTDISVMNSVRSVMTGLAVPVADVISVPFRAVYAMMDSMSSVANLREENMRLKNDIERLKQWRRQAEILQNENRQLRSVSGVIIPDSTSPVSARVIAVNSDSFAHSVIVNVGRNAGVQKGNAVTTTDGLVGIIIDVGPKHSQVLLVTDINAMIPVILSSSSWPATTAGTNNKLMQLRFLPAEATIAANELVQTSGHGGVLPPGIPVGRVERVTTNRISVKPVVDLQRLGFVTILTMNEDPGFAVDDIFAQRFRPLPVEDDRFSLEGINALGQRTSSDVTAGDNEQ